MFLIGTCNPRGENNDYNGLYFTDAELETVIKEKKMHNLPVKSEHCGSNIGHVIGTFMNENRELRCIIEIDESSVEGSLAKGFVMDNIAKDLSLGYTVDIQQSGQKLKACEKQILEVSLVRKGAREGCHITMCENDNKLYTRTTQQTCFEPYFSLQ